MTGRLRALASEGSENGEIEIDARNVRELLQALEQHVPGIGKLVEEGLSIAIDGDIIQDPFLEPTAPDCEIHFLPPIQGGAS